MVSDHSTSCVDILGGQILQYNKLSTWLCHAVKLKVVLNANDETLFSFFKVLFFEYGASIIATVQVCLLLQIYCA